MESSCCPGAHLGLFFLSRPASLFPRTPESPKLSVCHLGPLLPKKQTDRSSGLSTGSGGHLAPPGYCETLPPGLLTYPAPNSLPARTSELFSLQTAACNPHSAAPVCQPEGTSRTKEVSGSHLATLRQTLAASLSPLCPIQVPSNYRGVPA